MIKKFAFLLILLILTSAPALAAPTASLNANPTSGNAPLQVNFGGGCTDDNASTPIVSCKIDLDEGNPAVDLSSLGGSYTFSTAGTYDLNLLAVNSVGASHEEITQITVSTANQAPTAVLNASPTSGPPGVTVTFSGFCADPDGNATISTCFLNYGDGSGELIVSPYSFSGKTHSYTSAGNYTAQLMAKDNQDVNSSGQGGEETIVVSAANQAPVASSVQVSPSSPATGNDLTCNYSYSDAESDAEGTSLFLWFKDGAPTSNTAKTLSSSETVSGEEWRCQVTPVAATGTSPGADVNSSPVTVGGIAAPVISSPTHTENEWETSDDPEFNWNSISGATYYYVLDTSSGTTPGSGDNSTTSTSKTYSNQSNGEKWFHLRAKVGSEWSGTDHYKIKIDDEAPSVPDLHTADPDDEEVYLDWSASSDSYSGVKEYLVYRDDTHVKTTSSTAYTVENLANGTEYEFRVRARDNAGNLSGYSDTLEEAPSASGSSGNDTSAPYLNWELPDDGDVVSGTITLKVWSYDDESEVRFVKFYVDGVNVGTDSTAISERYSVQWDSSTVADGSHELRAISKSWASDEETNSRFKTIDIRTDNGVVEVEEDQNRAPALESIDSAEEEKEAAEKLFSELEFLGVSPSDEAATMFSDAEDALEDARQELEDEHYETCVEKAEEARQSFAGLQENLEIGAYGEKAGYVFNEEHFGLMLQEIGLQQSLREEAEKNLGESSVERSLGITRVSDNGSTEFRAVVTLKVRNNSAGAREFLVVEVIPKELAESASGIFGEGLTVVEDDPVVSWEISLGAGEEKEIAYVLGRSLTEEEASEMLESNSLNKFKVPPILMNAGTVLSKESFSAPSGLFGLGDGVALAGWAVLIIVVIGAALYAFSYFSQRERPTGLGAAEGKKGLGSGFIERFSKEKREDKSEGPRWAYRE